MMTSIGRRGFLGILGGLALLPALPESGMLSAAQKEAIAKRQLQRFVVTYDPSLIRIDQELMQITTTNWPATCTVVRGFSRA
jgi:hypothetical protein